MSDIKLDKIGVMNAIMDHPDLTNTERLIALKILKHRDERTSLCIVSQRTIAQYIGLSQQHTTRLVENLRSKGLLQSTWTYNIKTFRRGACQYFFLTDLELLDTLMVENGIEPLLKEHYLCVKQKLLPGANLRAKKGKK